LTGANPCLLQTIPEQAQNPVEPDSMLNHGFWIPPVLTQLTGQRINYRQIHSGLQKAQADNNVHFAHCITAFNFLFCWVIFLQATGLGQSPKQESLVITEAKLLQDLRLRPQQWHQSMEGNVYNK